MRLNFEFNVESYDESLCQHMDKHVAQIISKSTKRTLADVDGRSLPIRVRDGIARLFAPISDT